MIGGFNTLKFNERIFNDSNIKCVNKTENILIGANRCANLVSEKFVALIKAIVRSPFIKFRIKDND